MGLAIHTTRHPQTPFRIFEFSIQRNKKSNSTYYLQLVELSSNQITNTFRECLCHFGYTSKTNTHVIGSSTRFRCHYVPHGEHTFLCLLLMYVSYWLICVYFFSANNCSWHLHKYSQKRKYGKVSEIMSRMFWMHWMHST